MLVCNVSLRPPRRTIAADIAEAIEATDATASGQVVFATLVDDPASVGEIVDAYLGEIMVEAASAGDTIDGSIPAVVSADVAEAAAADSTQDGTLAAAWGFAGTWSTTDQSNAVLSNYNRTATFSLGSGGIRGLDGFVSGKYYFEITPTVWANSASGPVMATSSWSLGSGPGQAGSVGCGRAGGISVNGSSSGSGITGLAAGSTVGIAVDTTARLIWFRNAPSGQWNGSGTADPATGTGGVNISALTGSLYAGFASWQPSEVVTVNFGVAAFVGTAPSGFTTQPTAPSITSATTVSNTEGAVLAHSLTANEDVATWTITGGADAARFEISGATLRWLSNGVKDYDAPNDADANNSYIVTVNATDMSGNVSSDQTITVTVTVSVGGPPVIVTGLIGWWDAQVTASLTLSGSNVDAIADQSGGSQTLGWSIAKPTYNATGLNSRPTIVFASGQALQKTSFPMGTGNTLTWFYVGTLGTITSGGRTLSYGGGGQSADYNNAGSFLVQTNSSTTMILHRNGSSTSATTTAHPAVHRFIGTISSGGGVVIYIDGVSAGTGSAGGNWITNGSFNVGRNAFNTTELYAGLIGEVGVATGYSDATTVAALDTYLKNKWGL